MYKKVLLAYDGSEAGQKALLDCGEIAQWSGSSLFLIAVRPPATAYVALEGGVYEAGSEEQDRLRFQAILDEGLQRLAGCGRTATGEVMVGEAVDEIVQCAKRIDADLIVVGHKHLDSWAARWWRGSTARSLIEHAPCSVLVAIIH